VCVVCGQSADLMNVEDVIHGIIIELLSVERKVSNCGIVFLD
jgi:hypothetical protein